VFQCKHILLLVHPVDVWCLIVIKLRPSRVYLRTEKVISLPFQRKVVVLQWWLLPSVY